VIRALAVLAVAVALLALAGTRASAHPAAAYPPAFERAFMASCMQGRVELRSMCRCALTWLERRYTYRRLVSIYRNEPARFRRIALAAVMACRP
jgi:hypothetical protein